MQAPGISLQELHHHHRADEVSDEDMFITSINYLLSPGLGSNDATTRWLTSALMCLRPTSYWRDGSLDVDRYHVHICFT